MINTNTCSKCEITIEDENVRAVTYSVRPNNMWDYIMMGGKVYYDPVVFINASQFLPGINNIITKVWMHDMSEVDFT